MVCTRFSLPTIESAILDVCSELEESGRSGQNWSDISEDDLWREMVACILGSRVRYEIANSAVERLDERRLLKASRTTRDYEKYENDVCAALAGNPTAGSTDPVQHRYPFFRIRATQIRKAAQRLYEKGDSIVSFLKETSDVRDARRRLVSEIAGLGPKQSSLFLRNTGYASHIAVLDIHVLTYMHWAGLTETPVESVSTVKKYEPLESAFVDHSSTLGVSPAYFDLAVWLVVRAAKEVDKAWA